MRIPSYMLMPNDAVAMRKIKTAQRAKQSRAKNQKLKIDAVQKKAPLRKRKAMSGIFEESLKTQYRKPLINAQS